MKIIRWVFLVFAVLSIINIVLLSVSAFPYKHCSVRICNDSDYSSVFDDDSRYFLSTCDGGLKCLKYKRLKKDDSLCMPDGDQDIVVSNPPKCLFPKDDGTFATGNLSTDDGNKTSLKYILETGEVITHVEKVSCNPGEPTL